MKKKREERKKRGAEGEVEKKGGKPNKCEGEGKEKKKKKEGSKR